MKRVHDDTEQLQPEIIILQKKTPQIQMSRPYMIKRKEHETHIFVSDYSSPVNEH